MSDGVVDKVGGCKCEEEKRKKRAKSRMCLRVGYKRDPRTQVNKRKRTDAFLRNSHVAVENGWAGTWGASSLSECMIR